MVDRANKTGPHGGRNVTIDETEESGPRARADALLSDLHLARMPGVPGPVEGSEVSLDAYNAAPPEARRRAPSRSERVAVRQRLLDKQAVEDRRDKDAYEEIDGEQAQRLRSTAKILTSVERLNLPPGKVQRYALQHPSKCGGFRALGFTAAQDIKDGTSLREFRNSVRRD